MFASLVNGLGSVSGGSGVDEYKSEIDYTLLSIALPQADIDTAGQ